MEGMLIIVGMLCIAAMLVWVLRGKQGRRVVSWILCVALCCSYIPDISIAKADTVNLPVVSDALIAVNSIQKAQMDEVSYSEVPSEAADGETASSVWRLNDTTAMLRAGKKDTLSFSGTISASEGEHISWIRVDVYDAASQEPYTVGEEYFYTMNLNQQQYDLSNIPPMKIADEFGISDYVLEEGKQYIIMLQAGDSKGNLLQDLDDEVDGDQGPAVLLTVKLSPENCTHPHAHYQYILHDSGKTRVYCYGDSLVHQIEPLYERYCGLCDRYLMNIWGQGTPEEHSMVDGVCSVCGYIEGSDVSVALPEIQAISCSAGEAFTAGTDVTFTAVATAEAGLSEIALYIDDELRLSEEAAGTIDSLKCTINDLTIGEHTVKATVVDADGWYNEASYTVMVLQADFASCAHVNTVVQQTTQYIEDENGELQPITIDVVHCLDCATDLYTNEPVMTLDDNAADYEYTVKDGKVSITKYIGTETNVVVPETINGYTVAVIDTWAFNCYTAVVSVKLPNTIETVEGYAFSGDELAEIHVNKNAMVSKEAFSSCLGSTVVYGYAGSTAEIAAEAAGLAFVSVGSLAAAPTLTVEPDTVAYGEEYIWSVSHPDADTIWVQRSFEDEYGFEMYGYTPGEYVEGEYTRTADEFAENYIEVITAIALIDGDWSAVAQARVNVICDTEASGDYEYTVVNGTAQITGYVGTDTEVIIPSEIDGYTVTSIGDTAFLETDVVSVTFPSTLETLGGAVFYGCSSLESIYTNKKLMVEYASSFQDCEGVTVYGYSGGSVEAAAREAGCNFVSLGTLSSVVPVLTITPETVAYGEECEIKCELEGADLFEIRASFVSANESYEYSMTEAAEDGFLSMVLVMSYPDETPFSFTETYQVSARVNGEWTQYCAPQTVTVISDDGVLAAPVIHEIESPVPAHKELTISWDPVENAQEYEVWLHSIYGGYYELATSTPESTSRTLTIEEINNRYFPIGSDRENIDIDVEVTAKAQGYSSATSTASFTMSICQFGKPVLRGVPEQVMQEDGFEVTWEAVEYADEIDGDVYYEFLLLDEQGNETHLSGAWGDGANDLSCWLWFGSYYAPAPGDYTLRVLVSTYSAPIKESYSDYPIKVIAPFEYEIVDGEAVITGYNGSETYLTIPGTINGYPVVKIGDGAFEGNTTITQVYLPNSVTEIGAKAFKNCTALESISGPSVTSIGEEAFYGCVNLINVQFYKYIYYIGENAFYSVELPDYTQPLTVYIKDTDTVSFEGNDVIGKVAYPEGVTEIPARTHYANTKLAEVYLPTTLETIGSQAFAACAELNYVKLYDGITSIADDAFDGSSNTVLYIYVKDMETVSYVEQYAIDHQIPYHKFLYTTDGVVSPTVSVSSQTGGVIDVKENEVWVKVNEEIILGAAGNSAEVAHFYLNDKLVGKYEFESAVVEIPHTFTEPGDVTFYAKTYSGTELVETSQTLTIHVVGVALSVDKEEPWTCETVHFEMAASNLSGTASVYAEDTHLLDVEITDGKAEWEYAFRKAGQRTIKVVVDGLDPMEKTITVKCIDKLSAPVITAEAVQRLDDGMALSWNAIEHADGYVVRVINTAGETFLTEEIVADSTQTVSHTIYADKLQGAGTYAVFVMAYGYQYDQSESEAVNIAMVEENGFFFTVDKTQVTTGEPVTLTVYASGASAVELVVDGQGIEVYDMTNDILTIERAFSKSGDREVAFRALIDGAWSDACESKIIKVTSQGQLDDPMPETKQYHRLGSNIEVTWPAIEHADGYIIRVYDADGSKVYENEIEAAAEADVSETIPSETFVSCTVYSIDVQAYGAGYDQSEGSTTTEMLEKLPGPIIVKPADNEVLTERGCELAWKAVEGAQSYVVTLAKKTTNENGETVYEKVWASPNEVINVGNVLSYPLENLEYGAEYRAAVGAVLEGMGLDDATEVGWTERLFSVAMPELGITIAVNPETANEKQNVTITVSVENASVAAILQSDTDEIAPIRNEETENGREFEFVVMEQKQGTYTYTVLVAGTGEFAGVKNEKTVTVTYLDANAAVVHEITADPATCWAETDVAFEINANAMAEQVKIQLYQGETLITEKITEPGVYDLLLGDVNTHVFAWSHRFTDAGTYTLKVTPVNGDNESGTVFEMTYTVLERGKMPNPAITSPKSGTIETDESVTVTWDAVALSPEMAFGGYCILLEKQNEKGEYAAVPAYTYVNTNETSYTLAGLEPGGAYRLHLYTLEKDHIEPDGKLHGEAENVDFTYRTVPEFKITSISGGDMGDPITVSWDAPVWSGKNLKPEFYLISLIGPDGNRIGDAARVENTVLTYTIPGSGVMTMGDFTVRVSARMASWDTQTYMAQYVASEVWSIGDPEILEVKRTNGIYQYENDLFKYTVKANRQTHHIEVRGVGDDVLTFTRESRDVDFEISFGIEKRGIYGIEITPVTYSGERGDAYDVDHNVYVIERYSPYKTMYAALDNVPVYSLPGYINHRIVIALDEEVEVRGEINEYYYIAYNGSTYFGKKEAFTNKQERPMSLELYTMVDEHEYDDTIILVWNENGIPSDLGGYIKIETLDGRWSTGCNVLNDERASGCMNITDLIVKKPGKYRATMSILNDAGCVVSDSTEFLIKEDWAMKYVDRLAYIEGDLYRPFTKWIRLLAPVSYEDRVNSGYLWLEELLDDEYDYEAASKWYRIPLYNGVVKALKIDIAGTVETLTTSYMEGYGEKTFSDLLMEAGALYINAMNRSANVIDESYEEAIDAADKLAKDLFDSAKEFVDDGKVSEFLGGNKKLIDAFEKNGRDIRLTLRDVLAGNGISTETLEGLDVALKWNGQPKFKLSTGEAEKLYKVFKENGWLNTAAGKKFEKNYLKASAANSRKKAVNTVLKSYSVYSSLSSMLLTIHNTSMEVALEKKRAIEALEIMVQYTDEYVAMLESFKEYATEQQKGGINRYIESIRNAQEVAIKNRADEIEAYVDEIADKETLGKRRGAGLEVAQYVYDIFEAVGAVDKVLKFMGVPAETLKALNKAGKVTMIMQLAGCGIEFGFESIWSVTDKYEAAEDMYAVLQMTLINIARVRDEVEEYKKEPGPERARSVIAMLKHLKALKYVGENAAMAYTKVELNRAIQTAYEERRDQFIDHLWKRQPIAMTAFIGTPERTLTMASKILLDGKEVSVNSYLELAELVRAYGGDRISLQNVHDIFQVKPLKENKMLYECVLDIVDIINVNMDEAENIYATTSEWIESLEIP